MLSTGGGDNSGSIFAGLVTLVLSITVVGTASEDRKLGTYYFRSVLISFNA